MRARISMAVSARRLASCGMSAFFMLLGAAEAQMYEPPPPYDYPPVPMAPVPRVPNPAYGPGEYYPPEPDPEEMFRHRRPDMVIAPDIDDLEGPGPRRRALVPPSPKHEEKTVARRAVPPRRVLGAAPARSLRVPASAPRKIAVTEAPPPQSVTRQQSSHERAAPQGKAAPPVSSAPQAPAPAPAPALVTTSRADPSSAHKAGEAPSRPLNLPMNATEGKSNIDR